MIIIGYIVPADAACGRETTKNTPAIRGLISLETFFKFSISISFNCVN